MDVSALLPGVAAVLVALFGGAGASLLLELWWNPRRARWREAQRTKRDDVKELERNAIGAVDAFNVLIDVTYKAAGELLPVLLRYAPKREHRAVSDEEYAERVRTAEAERVARLSRV